MSTSPLGRAHPALVFPAVAAALVTVAAAGAGCGKSEAAPLGRATSEPANTQAARAKGDVRASPTSRADAETYVAEIKPSGPYTAGTEGAVKITLAPKGGYHINAQYPYKFKVNEPAPEGVTFSKPNLTRADGTFEEKHGSFSLPFVAAKAGSYSVGGTLSLSVCSDANCFIDKVPLEVTVDVK